MKLWTRYSLAIMLAILLAVPSSVPPHSDRAMAGSGTGTAAQETVTRLGSVILHTSPRHGEKDELGRRVTTTSTAVGVVMFKKPAKTCPEGTELVASSSLGDSSCVRKCPRGTVLFGANCVSDGSSPFPQSDPRPEPEPEPLPEADLARPLQNALKRLGCLKGNVDGIWGRQSRAALAKFVNKAGLGINRREPTLRALREAQDRPRGYCVPARLKCRGDTYAEGGKCVCDSGFRKRGDKCIRKDPTCRGDTYLENGRCVCDSGYTKRGSKCIRNKPKCRGDTYLKNGRCVCDKGYRKRGSRCIPKRQRCRANQYRCNGNECCNRSQTDPEAGGSSNNNGGNRKSVKKCQQKCGVRLIGCMIKYNNKRKCEQQLGSCKARYGC